jgi:hypothetical protein
MSKHSALNTFGRSGNPAFTRNFENTESFSQAERMTLDGAVNKTAILLGTMFCWSICRVECSCLNNTWLDNWNHSCICNNF